MPRVTAFNFSTAKARKPAAPADAPPEPKDDPAIKHMTVRLNPTAWRTIRQLAVDLDTTSHSLILEGLNAVFQKHGKPPVAQGPGKNSANSAVCKALYRRDKLADGRLRTGLSGRSGLT